MRLTPDAAVTEALRLDPGALAQWNASPNKYRVAEVFFNGNAVELFTVLETFGAYTGTVETLARRGTRYEGQTEIPGSAFRTSTPIDALSCERIETFYRDGRPVDEDADEDIDGSGRAVEDTDEDSYQSAVQLRYYGMWPSEAAVAAVARRCEGVKKRMQHAGYAEIAIRAATFPAGFVLVSSFGTLVSRCSASCRRNKCHGSLPTIGRSSLYLLGLILLVDLLCLTYYARVFPDMDDSKVGAALNSITFAMMLPLLVQTHAIVAVGALEVWTIERAGFAVAAFVWVAHLVAILLIALVVKNGNAEREFDDARVGAPTRKGKGWGRWYRPERENDAMPPDVATAAPRALQMPSVAEHFKTGVAGSIPDEDDDASTDVSVSDVSEGSEGSEGSDVSGVSGVSTPSVTDSDEEDVERAEKKEEVEEKKGKKKFLGLF